MGEARGDSDRARRRREKELARRARRAAHAGGDAKQTLVGANTDSQSLSPYGGVRAIERCHPPVHVTPGLVRTRDPLEVLGLDPTRRASRAQILAAFQTALAAHPPEREPEVARELIDARDRLTRPERVLERELGVLYPPDPAQYGLATAAAPEPHTDPKLPSRPRLMASLVLYALLEAELDASDT